MLEKLLTFAEAFVSVKSLHLSLALTSMKEAEAYLKHLPGAPINGRLPALPQILD
jgi:hypothetical protein